MLKKNAIYKKLAIFTSEMGKKMETTNQNELKSESKTHSLGF